jgi:hypothetical protein
MAQNRPGPGSGASGLGGTYKYFTKPAKSSTPKKSKSFTPPLDKMPIKKHEYRRVKLVNAKDKQSTLRQQLDAANKRVREAKKTGNSLELSKAVYQARLLRSKWKSVSKEVKRIPKRKYSWEK